MRSTFRASGQIRVDPVDVGVDLAHVRLEGSGERDRAGVRASPAERRDVARRVDSLEAGDDRHPPPIEHLAQARVVDRLDARLRERAVGPHPYLMPEEGARRRPGRVQRDRQQRRAHLLPGRHQRVHLPRVRRRRELPPQREEPVGLPRHRAHHHDHVVPLAPRPRDPLRDRPDPIRGAHARAAVLLDDQAHRAAMLAPFRRAASFLAPEGASVAPTRRKGGRSEGRKGGDGAGQGTAWRLARARRPLPARPPPLGPGKKGRWEVGGVEESEGLAAAAEATAGPGPGGERPSRGPITPVSRSDTSSSPPVSPLPSLPRFRPSSLPASREACAADPPLPDELTAPAPPADPRGSLASPGERRTPRRARAPDRPRSRIRSTR